MLDHLIVTSYGSDLCMCGRIDCVLIETIRERGVLFGRICFEKSGIFDATDSLAWIDVDSQPNVFGHDADVDGNTFGFRLCRAVLQALDCAGVC